MFTTFMEIKDSAASANTSSSPERLLNAMVRRDTRPRQQHAATAAQSNRSGDAAGALADLHWSCPFMPRHWWPLNAVGGYCEETESEGDCERGSKGTFSSFYTDGYYRGRRVSIGECARLCAGCKRCNYFSVAISPDTVDCSWYHSCDLRRTRHLANANFVSMSLQSAKRYQRLCRSMYHDEACN